MHTYRNAATSIAVHTIRSQFQRRFHLRAPFRHFNQCPPLCKVSIPVLCDSPRNYCPNPRRLRTSSTVITPLRIRISSISARSRSFSPSRSLKTNSRSVQPSFLAITSRVMCSAQQSRGWHDCCLECVACQLACRRTIHIALHAQVLRRKIEGVGNDPDQEFLPGDAQIGICSGAEAQYFRLSARRRESALCRCLRSRPATSGSIARDGWAADPVTTAHIARP